MVKLKDYLILNENKIKPAQNPEVNYKVLGVSNKIGIFLNEKLQAEETSQSYFVVGKNEFCYNPYRINVGSIGLNTFDYDNQIISGAYLVFGCKEDEMHPKFLDAFFKSRVFLYYVNEKANGGVRMNFKFEDMESWEIPLPTLDEQVAIVAQIEKQRAIIEGVDRVDEQITVLKKIKDMFASNIASKREIDIKEIFGNPIYERLIGSYDSINQKFDGKFDSVIRDLRDSIGGTRTVV